jgi:hypothetical protein
MSPSPLLVYSTNYIQYTITNYVYSIKNISIKTYDLKHVETCMLERNKQSCFLNIAEYVQVFETSSVFHKYVRLRGDL